MDAIAIRVEALAMLGDRTPLKQKGCPEAQPLLSLLHPTCQFAMCDHQSVVNVVNNVCLLCCEQSILVTCSSEVPAAVVKCVFAQPKKSVQNKHQLLLVL